jgi:hypothetical protein
MKTPAQASAKYVANGGSGASQTLWAANLVAALPTAFDAASAAGPLWQTNVSLPQSLTNFRAGLARAKANQTPIVAKINGPAKASFTSGVTTAGGPNGYYTQFINNFLPAVSGEVTALNTTNPRGTSSQNRARLNAYLDWAESKKGTFKVK